MKTAISPVDPRLRRDRVVVMGLVVLVLIAMAAYVLAVMSSASRLRTQHALEQSGDTARLSARLLDVQCDSALYVLRALAQQPLFEARLRARDRSGLRGQLRSAVELVPDLLFVAAYSSTGRLLEQHPSASQPPGDVGAEGWFRHISATGTVFIGDVRSVTDETGQHDALTMAVPVGPRGHTTGYLLAYYRLGDIYEWLREVHVSGGNIVIVGPDGRVIAASGAPTPPQVIPVNAALTRARQGSFGAMVLSDPLGATGESVVGYALAVRPQWTVLVTEAADSAFAPSDYLLRRLPLITAPLILLLGLAAWNLINLYHRQQRLAGQLAERNVILYEQDRAKSDLLANVSHDLKTPIASMQLSVSGLLEDDGNSSTAWERSQVAECLSLVSQELDELSGRVRNLLDMSRLDAAGSVGGREHYDLCDIADIVASVLERLRLLLRGRIVDARFPPEPLLVEGDPTQIETVVMNLLENAVKYSAPGTPIHLRGDIAGDRIVLSVRDEGPGIPEAERSRIFDKFYRSPTRYASGGTGLGLAICKAIVEAHGGTITVAPPAPREGGDIAAGGAEFVISLPRIEETV